MMGVAQRERQTFQQISQLPSKDSSKQPSLLLNKSSMDYIRKERSRSLPLLLLNHSRT